MARPSHTPKPQPENGSGTVNIRQQLHTDLFERKQRDDYGVLDLARGADDEAIRAAYLTLSKRYHPHRYARFSSPEYRRLATELYVLVQRAYARLSESSRMPSHDSEERKRSVRRSARDALDQTVSAAVTCLTYRQHAEAVRMLSEVLQQDPERDSARLWLMVASARLALERGDKERAIECYRSVLTLQASHVEAHEKLKELTAPAEPERKSSLFQRLWHGKE